MAKPIPCVEAVTIATFPSNLFDFTISTFDAIQANTHSPQRPRLNHPFKHFFILPLNIYQSTYLFKWLNTFLVP